MNKLEFLDYSQVEKLSDSDDIKERVKFNPEYASKVKDFFNADPKDRITLLQSVRGENEIPQYVKNYVEKAESEGKKVYVPFHYNYQQDETGGIQICNNMRLAVEQAGIIAVAYNPASEGTKFDFGISIYYDKPIVLLNPDLSIGLNEDLLYSYMKIKSGLIKDIQFGNTYLKKDVNKTREIFKKDCDRASSKNEFMNLSLDYYVRMAKSPGLTLSSATQFGSLYASKMPFKIFYRSKVFVSDLLEAEILDDKTAEKYGLDKEFMKNYDVNKQLELEVSLGTMKSYTRVSKTLESIFLEEKNRNLKN